MKFTYASGDRPLGGFTIKRAIGRGGFGEVYYATSDGGKEVALKLVQRNLDVELRGVSQCLNLKHPNLVRLYDVRQSENGDCWIVMEYLGGECLADVIAGHPEGMPPEEALRWLEGVVKAVDYLHSRGIVHRDLKPGNIFDEEGLVKIGDYGLSKFISASRRSGQTESVGTVHYMAPEIANGRYGKEIDVYAVGIILYELLTGQVPFTGESMGEILMKHLTAQPDLGPLPQRYRRVVARALAKDPDGRYRSLDDMLADVDGRAPQAEWSEGAEEDPVAGAPEAERTQPDQPARAAIASAEAVLQDLRRPPEILGDAVCQLWRLFTKLVKLCLTIAMLCLALAFVPLRFCVWVLSELMKATPKISGYLPASHKPRKDRVEVRQRVGNPVTNFFVNLLRFGIVGLLSIGVAMVMGGLAMSTGADDDQAIALAVGVGFVTFGILASRLCRTAADRTGGIVVAGLGLAAAVSLGVGVGLLTGGIMLWAFGVSDEEPAIMFGVGAGFLTCAIAAANLFLPSEGLLRGLWVIVLRIALAMFLGAGVGLATAGLVAMLMGGILGEEAVLLGVGAGFVSFAVTAYKLFADRSPARRPHHIAP